MNCNAFQSENEPEEWEHGLELLRQWTEEAETRPSNIDTVTERTVRPRVRGIQETTHASVQQMVREGEFLSWWRENRKECVTAIKKALRGGDRELRRALCQLTDFATELNNDTNAHSELERDFLEAAIAETTARLEMTAQPYIPKKYIDEKKDHQKERGLLNLSSILKPLHRLLNVFKREQNTIPPELADTIPPHTCIEGIPSFGYDKYLPGLERKELFGGKRTLLRAKVGNDMPDKIFMGVRAFNRQDPETGEYSIDAQRAPLTFERAKFTYFTCDMNLAPGDIPKEATEIAIPRPLFYANRRVTSGMEKFVLSSMEIRSSRGKALVPPETLEPLMQEDTLGNITLTLNQEIAQHIKGKTVTIHCSFVGAIGNSLAQFVDASENLIGPENQPAGPVLQPQKILDLTAVAQHRRRQKKGLEGWIEGNPAATLELIARFLGNHWLTYEKLDAPHSEEDPVGTKHADRVLNSRIASCEGATSAAGNIVKKLLQPGEGIAYLEGYVMTGNEYDRIRTATAKNHHGTLLCVWGEGENRNAYAVDATPWSAKDHAQIQKLREKRSAIIQEWNTGTKAILDERRQHGLPIIDESKEARKRIEECEDTIRNTWDWMHIEQTDHLMDMAVRSAGKNVSSITQSLPGAKTSLYTANCIKVNPIFYKSWTNETIAFTNLRDFLIEHILRKSFPSAIKNLRHFSLREATIADKNKFDGKQNSSVDGYFNIRLPPLKLFRSDAHPEWAECQKAFQKSVVPQWKKLRKPLLDMFAMAQNASVQNLEVMEYFGKRVTSLTEEYQNALKDVFESTLSQQMNGNEKKWWNAAPWMLLLPTPAKHLRDFFTRSEERGKEGFLSPATQPDIDTEFDARLRNWREEVADVLQTIKEALERMPPTPLQTEQKVEMPAMRFLRPGTSATAETVFQYLAKKVRKQHKKTKGGTSGTAP